MLIKWKSYSWPNPKTGDEFLYFFLEDKNNKGKYLLNIQPAKHPFKQHPLGYLSLISLPLWLASLLFIKDKSISQNIDMCWKLIFTISFITGSFFSIISYLFYYPKEKKWKQKIINDWRQNKLRHTFIESKLRNLNSKDLNHFNENDFY